MSSLKDLKIKVSHVNISWGTYSLGNGNNFLPGEISFFNSNS